MSTNSELDLLFRMVPQDSYIIYMDANGNIARLQKSHRFPFTIEVGDRIEQDHIKKTNTARCYQEKKYLEAQGNPETFGFNYVSKSIPLYEDETFRGVVSVVFPSDNTKLLEQGVNNLSEHVGMLDTLGHEMAVAGQEQATNSEAIANSVEDLSHHAKALVEINALVSEVATQTNLLGLNASIESARAGDLGRGFGVVASEIRRLSTTVKDSSKQVNGKIGEILRAIDSIQKAIHESSANTEELSAQLQELSASVAQVHQTTVTLSKLK